MLQFVYSDNFPLGFRLIPSNYSSAHEAESLIEVVIENLRRHVGNDVEIFVRGDGDYGVERIMGMLETRLQKGEKTYYTLGFGSNKRVRKLAKDKVEQKIIKQKRAKNLKDMESIVQFKKKPFKSFVTVQYRTKKTWTGARKIVAKREIIPNYDRLIADDRTRYVVNNLPEVHGLTPREIYCDIYCQRGTMENHIKKGKNDLDYLHASMMKMNANRYLLVFKVFAQAWSKLMRIVLFQGTRFQKLRSERLGRNSSK